MDEEDGRPGPVSRQIGPADAQVDVPASSLRPYLFCTTQLTTPGPFRVPAGPHALHIKEKCHENVPGK